MSPEFRSPLTGGKVLNVKKDRKRFKNIGDKSILPSSSKGRSRDNWDKICHQVESK